ncbi:MAG: selenium-binding protein [Chloroflexi bacterium]|nr:MAG: selenium-binding protein [Chloroflexota bacterium]
MEAPREQLAYVVTLNTEDSGRPDALCVLDVDPASSTYSQVVGRVDMPTPGDELHHFGWNACSACLCHGEAHAHMERRYLLVPGLRSSRIHILDTRPDPRSPRLVKIISADEVASRTGYSRPHTIHCGSEAIYVSALGAPEGEGPGGVFTLDPDDFGVRSAWEVDRGTQYLAYDFWWHLGHDTLISSEWGTPSMVEAGVNPDLLLAGKYGHSLHVWTLSDGSHVQSIDLGAEQQMVLEVRPSHDPAKTYGFVNAVISLKNLSSSIWVWYLEGGTWQAQKVIEIPAEPADADLLPPVLKPFAAVPPFVTDIDLSLDDRDLYVSCWGTGEFRRYDVSDPFHPQLTGSVRLGGVVGHAPHPGGGALNGGPQMVEVSRDGRRIYVSNSLYTSWDSQLYPEGIRGWVAKLDAGPAEGLALDPGFFVTFTGERPHQIRLQGGDASSDSYCFSS